jgi:hypothetical protein
VGREWAGGCDEKDISTVVAHPKWRKEDYFTSLTITFQPNKEGLSEDKSSLFLYRLVLLFDVVLQSLDHLVAFLGVEIGITGGHQGALYLRGEAGRFWAK